MNEPAFSFSRFACGHRWPEYGARVTGVLVMVLGLTVMVGWHAHVPALVQLHPTFAPMQYNSALCFLGAGAALLAIGLKARRLALPFTCLVTLIGLLTLAQYMFAISFGIDQLLFQPYIFTQTSHPGRMSPVTALAFSLSGLALIAGAVFHRRPWGWFLIGLLSSLVLALSSMALLGYGVGLTGAYGWGQLTQMALHTAFGFLALGVGLFAKAWREEFAATNRSPRWLPITTGLTALSATLVLWHALAVRGRAEMEQTVQANAATVKNEIVARLEARIRSLSRMAVRWEFSGQPKRDAWEADASSYIEHDPGYQVILWVDPQLRVQWAAPLANNAAMLNQELTGAERREALGMARDQRRATFSRPVQLFVGGGTGMLASVPIYHQERFEGFIVGVVRFQEMFDATLRPDLAAGYGIALVEGGNRIYLRPGGLMPVRNEWVVESPIEILGAGWTAKVWPGTAVLAAQNSHHTRAVLILGVLASLLLGLSVLLAQSAIARSQKLAASNHELHRAEAELKKSHQELLEVSRKAGMAEIATNVLHNVGNVLNSVNISTGLIVDGVKKSKTARLAQVVGLLQEHAHDIGEFVTNNPKGKQVPDYLAGLSEHLLAEQAAMVAELDSLRRNVEHIKEIVAMQQNYAMVGGVKEMMNVVNLVEDSLRMNEGDLSRHSVVVICEFATVPPMNVEKHKILQILVNLLRNAKQACDDSERADKRLTVRVANGAGSVKISVMDNGVGIAPENLTRIFSHGFTTRKGGHGFGLHGGALTAKELDGSLTVHSDGPGQGATFTLELPCPKQEIPHE